MAHDFQKKQQPRSTSSSRTKQIWCPPASNQVKINFDGAFSPTTKKGAWSFLARDQTGEVVLAGAGNMRLACDALMVEATTCLRALELADQFGISHIQLETDSTQLEEAIRTGSRDLSTSGNIFKAIRELLQLRFVVLNFRYVSRSCNSSAHEIAQLAKEWEPGQIQSWSDSFPHCVIVAVACDLAELSLHNTRP